jgi:hypothetical protein
MSYLRLNPSIGHDTGGLDEYTIACKFKMSNRRYGSQPGFLSLVVGHSPKVAVPPELEGIDQEADFGHVCVVFGDAEGHHLLGCYDPDDERLDGVPNSELQKGGVSIDVSGCVHSYKNSDEKEPLDVSFIKNGIPVTMVMSCEAGKSTIWLLVDGKKMGPYIANARVKVPIDAMCNAPGYRQPFGDLYWFKIWHDECLDAEALLDAHSWADGETGKQSTNESMQEDELLLRPIALKSLNMLNHRDQLRELAEHMRSRKAESRRHEDEIQVKPEDDSDDDDAEEHLDSEGDDDAAAAALAYASVVEHNDPYPSAADQVLATDSEESIHEGEIRSARFKSVTRANHKYQFFEDGTWLAGKFNGGNFVCGRRSDGIFVKRERGNIVDVAHQGTCLADAQHHYQLTHDNGISNGFIAPHNEECPLAEQLPGYKRRIKHPMSNNIPDGYWIYDKESHAFLGLRVFDIFEGLGRLWGTVIARLPLGHSDDNLWKVRFDDPAIGADGIVELSEQEVSRLLETADSFKDPMRFGKQEGALVLGGHSHYLQTVSNPQPNVADLSSSAVADTGSLWMLMENHGTIQQMNELRTAFGIAKGKEQSDPTGFGMLAMTPIKDHSVIVDPTAKFVFGAVPEHLEAEDYIHVQGGFFLLRDKRGNRIAATYFVNDADYPGETKTCNMKWSKTWNDEKNVWQLSWRIQANLDKRQELMTRYRSHDAPQNEDENKTVKRQRKNINDLDETDATLKRVLDSGILEKRIRSAMNDASSDGSDDDGETEKEEFAREWLDRDAKQLMVDHKRCLFDPDKGLNNSYVSRCSGNIFKDKSQPIYGVFDRTFSEGKRDFEDAAKEVGEMLHLPNRVATTLKEWIEGGRPDADGNDPELDGNAVVMNICPEALAENGMVELPSVMLDTNWLLKTPPECRGSQEFQPAEVVSSHFPVCAVVQCMPPPKRCSNVAPFPHSAIAGIGERPLPLLVDSMHDASSSLLICRFCPLLSSPLLTPPPPLPPSLLSHTHYLFSGAIETQGDAKCQ